MSSACGIAKMKRRAAATAEERALDEAYGEAFDRELADMMARHKAIIAEVYGSPTAEELAQLVEEVARKATDRNATCTRCGSPAYLGLTTIECLASVCEWPLIPEPLRIIYARERNERSEPAFAYAHFDGYFATRDLAIEAWCKAQNAIRLPGDRWRLR